MPKNATILMIRHAEKPVSGDGLSPAGKARALAYVGYFQKFILNSSPLKLSYLFASEDSSKSHRPVDTITPLSLAVNLPIDAKHLDDDYQKLATDLLTHDKYDNCNSLVCWHHGKILKFAKALGAHHAVLPTSANWPHKWPSEVFGWLLRLEYDANGDLIASQTVCLNEHLMPDDTLDPPGPATTGDAD